MPKESFPPILTQKSNFRWVGANFAHKLGETRSNFGETFGGEWKTFRLPSLKIWKRSDKKWGRYKGPKMGFQISDNTCVIFKEEDARS